MIADDPFILAESTNNLHEKNQYVYCDNNPIVRDDQGGDVWGWLIGATVGAVAGVVGQIVSDVVTSLLIQEVTISSWQTYTGAAIGGAVLATTGNVNAANAVSGAVTTVAGMALDKVTGNSEYSWGEIAVNTLADGVVGFECGKAPGVNGITSGRNSWSAVFRSGLTKLRNGTAIRMSKRCLERAFCLQLLVDTPWICIMV